MSLPVKRAALVMASAMSLMAMLPATVTAKGADESKGSDPHARHKQMAMHKAEAPGETMQLEIPSAEMVTQNGQRLDFKADIVADRLVVVDFVYTTCTTVCPVLSAIMSQVRNKLGDRLGEDVVLVSVSVDPKRDTPAKLKKYSANFNADDDWLWLTGDKQTVDQVLKNLGAYTPNFEDHPSMILVGDGKANRWSRFVGFPGADAIVGKIDQLTSERRHGASSGG